MLKERLLIVDVGSRWGLHKRWERVSDRIEVIAFDADSGAESPETPYKTVYKTGALSDSERQATLYLTRKPACSSLYSPNHALLARFPEPERYDVVKEIPIQTRPLRSFGVHADFLKLDTQGSELD
ncbi:MAG: FkbM family methyltransferase, partial [Gemmatimonadota bacterium]|nr:FkbM family methyltransferase [Gemmatimonadota bacterium]